MKEESRQKEKAFMTYRIRSIRHRSRLVAALEYKPNKIVR